MGKADMHDDGIITSLRGLYNGDDADYTWFFDRAAERQRNRWVTDLESLRKMLVGSSEPDGGGTRENALTVAKELDKIGVGRLTGKSKTRRVEWLYRLDSVGEVARGDHDNLVKKGGSDAELEEDEEEAPLTIPEAKRRLAKTLEIDPSKIKIIFEG
jgi:hypothetical protein